MLQNEYLVVKIGVDAAENEPLKVFTSFFNIFQSCAYLPPLFLKFYQQLSNHEEAAPSSSGRY